MKIGIPDGVRVLNRKETFQINQIKEKIKDIFEKWGYEEIKLPYFEYFDVHEKGIGKSVSKKAFKIVDRTTGDILSLRADFTAQIARYFSSLKRKNIPKRYYYEGKVFRYETPKAGRLWEKLQMGIELIGVSHFEADAEVIAVASKALENLGIREFQIDISNVNLFKAIKEFLSMSEEEFSVFMTFVKNREIFSLEKFFEDKNIDTKIKNFLIKIPEYQGDISLIKGLKKEFSGIDSIQKSLQELEEIYKILKAYSIEDKIIFDLGEPKEFSYYTGIVFEIFIKDFSKPVGQGGRYDKLIGKYNGDYPATGFAFELFNLWEYLSKKGLLEKENKKDFYIIDITPDKEKAYYVAKTLREKGFTVARDIVDRDYRKSLMFAFEEGFKAVVLIGLDRDKESVYIYTNPEEYEKLEIKDFLEKV